MRREGGEMELSAFSNVSETKTKARGNINGLVKENG